MIWMGLSNKEKPGYSNKDFINWSTGVGSITLKTTNINEVAIKTRLYNKCHLGGGGEGREERTDVNEI
jgi:hypothetical protein